MLPSIKESDRFTTDDRLELGAHGVLLTIFAIAVNIALWVLGWVAFYFVFLALLGPVFVAHAMCSTYKGHIKLVATPRQANCPSCFESQVEWYLEKSSNGGRDAKWTPKLHCRWCGYKAERGASGASDVATAVASNTTTAASSRAGGASTLPFPQDLPNDPIAKAQAILRASKAKQRSQDGKAEYETVAVVEAKIVSSEDASTFSTTTSTTHQKDDVVEVTGRNIV